MEKTRHQPTALQLKSNLAHLPRMDRRLFWTTLRTGLLLSVVFGLFLALVQFSSPDLPDNDGYYHIKLAYLMRTDSLKPDFPYLPLTILNSREYYDHHFLFHVALIPFTFGDLRTGAKWAAVFFATLAFLGTWLLFRNQRIPYSWLWAAGLLAVSEAFIYRMSITRAQSLSLLVLVLGMDWLLRKKYTRLAFLAFAYVWLYNAFPLLLVVAGLYVLSLWIIERRLDFRPLLYAGVGTVLGLLVNPYFPDNIVFAYQHILPKLSGDMQVRVGNEWYPYDTSQLLENSALSLVAFASGALALGLSGRRMDLRTLFAFLLACLFGLMLFQSRRFIEYFPPFALVFAAFAWSPLFQRDTGTSHVDLVKETPARQKPAWYFRKTGWMAYPSRWLPAAALAVLLVYGIWTTFSAAQDSLRSSKPYETYAGASAWLTANTPAGARVFQTDWDDFPRLFYYNTHNTYLVGLDPTYMQIFDAQLYDRWVDITRGQLQRPSAAILRDFDARYIVTDLRHTGFLQQAGADPCLEQVYLDDHSAVFRVVGGCG